MALGYFGANIRQSPALPHRCFTVWTDGATSGTSLMTMQLISLKVAGKTWRSSSSPSPAPRYQRVLSKESSGTSGRARLIVIATHLLPSLLDRRTRRQAASIGSEQVIRVLVRPLGIDGLVLHPLRPLLLLAGEPQAASQARSEGRTWLRQHVKVLPSLSAILEVDSSGATVGHGLIVIASPLPRCGLGRTWRVVRAVKSCPRLHRLLKLEHNGATVGQILIVIAAHLLNLN